MKIIYTRKIVIHCNTCGSQMVYHACYKVQYKSNILQTEIVILRYKCRQCNMTHVLKPEFLASRHQYDTFERQTVMYYWVRIVEIKKQKIEPLLLADLQQLLPQKDIVEELAQEAQKVPPTVREKEYSRKTAILLQWTSLYTKALDAWGKISGN